jgi:hypothetical protein
VVNDEAGQRIESRHHAGGATISGGAGAARLLAPSSITWDCNSKASDDGSYRQTPMNALARNSRAVTLRLQLQQRSWRPKPALFRSIAVMWRISPRLMEHERARQESQIAMPGASTRSRRTVSIGVICHPRALHRGLLNDWADPARQ